jgi:hypothetical protein
MKTLSALVERDSFDVPAFALDTFQRAMRDNLHLEFFLARGRLIVTPHLSHLTTDEASPVEESRVKAILDEKQDLLEQLKTYLLYSLSVYSALLETNSSIIAVDEHRLIARFLPYGLATCEVKLYTFPPGDPLDRYGDRIYLGRDCLPLDCPQRSHLGLGYLRHSLPEQVAKLKLRLERDAKGRQRVALEAVGELDGLVDEFKQQADAVLRAYPPEISSRSLPPEKLLEVNRDFREIRHVLSEAETLVREMEQGMLAEGAHAARYVTKLRQDLTNDVNYILVKVNGRIGDAVNGIRF